MTIVAMATAFWVSYALLWGLVLLFGLLIILLFRQFGLAFMRPLERTSMQGLDVGSRAPDLELTDKQGGLWHVTFGPPADGRGSTVIIFALPTCEICAGLAATLTGLPADQPQTRFVWVDGVAPDPPERAVDSVEGWITGSAPDDALHRQWDVSAVPFCFVVGADGRISDKHLVNRREDVERALDMPAHPRMEITTSRSSSHD